MKETIVYRMVVAVDYTSRHTPNVGYTYVVTLSCGHRQTVRAYNVRPGASKAICPECSKKGHK